MDKDEPIEQLVMAIATGVASYSLTCQSHSPDPGTACQFSCESPFCNANTALKYNSANITYLVVNRKYSVTNKWRLK